MSPFQIVRDPLLGEAVHLATTQNGLRLRVSPKPQFREIAAAITFAYGSTDLAFASGDGICTSPPGTAHYLEHKLFEDEELHTFERFAARGARVNASTGFTRTTYHFTSTSNLRDNLTDLLHLVSRAHITPANVDKERGIIAQEVRMYEDSVDFGSMFDLLGCLYGEHPVRYTLGGTTESIQAITAELLLQCHRAFYRCGNAALAVAGPVDPEEVFDLAAACALPAGNAPERCTKADHGPVATARRERPRQVSRPHLLLGCKDPRPAGDWRQRLHRQLSTRVLLDRLLSPSSELREALRQRGDVDDTLGSGYYGEQTFAFATVGCETEQPDRAEAALRELLLRPFPLDAEHLERVRRRQLGGYVRGFESTRALAFGGAAEALEDVPPFEALPALQALQLEHLRERQHELLQEERFAVALTLRA